MSFKETFSSIAKMGKKDPLKMLFAVVMISILPLLVVGTLTEVLLRSRASGPISGATGPATQKVRFRGSYIKPPTCPEDKNKACEKGSEIIVFYNSTAKTLTNVKVDNFFYDKITPAGGRQQVVFPPMVPSLTNSEGTQTYESLPAVTAGEAIYVAIKPEKTIRESQDLASSVMRFNFSGQECAPASRVNCPNWSESTVELSMDEAVQTLPPQKNNHFTFSNNLLAFSVNGFVIKKDGNEYYGTNQNLKNDVKLVSNNQIQTTTEWDENSYHVKLEMTIKREINQWWIEKLSFTTGDTTFTSTYPFPRLNFSSPYSPKNIYIPGPNGSFALLNQPYLKVPFNNGEINVPTPTSSVYDLNNDDVLDLKDYTLMVHDFGKTGQAKFSKADLNGDGVVNKADSDQLVDQIKVKKLHKLK